MNINWNILIINNCNYNLTISISKDTSVLRNAIEYYSVGKYWIVHNTHVERTDSENLFPMNLNPNGKSNFNLKYYVRNDVTEPMAEGRYQFYENMKVDSNSILKDSIFINLFRFPDDSMKILATETELNSVGQGDLIKYYYDTVNIYRDSITGTIRNLNVIKN